MTTIQSRMVISSKSFTTLETLTNAQNAVEWLVDCDLSKHLVAVTANTDTAIKFGIAEENIFPLWDWVGGRYSVWSAIGLPLLIAVGKYNFQEFLAGAYEMDQHFRNTEFKNNIPVIHALISIWYNNYFDAQSYAIMPYAYPLRYFPDYLKQLYMESLGKSVQQDGNDVVNNTGPILWGGVGCNGQHAFHQLFHQGTRLTPMDFILPINSQSPLSEQHDLLYALCISQSQALMLGNDTKDPAKRISGNRPSNTILVDKLSPKSLGALIAMYEHSVYVQSVIWNINAFDQWGVELGKELFKDVLSDLRNNKISKEVDGSTKNLINQFQIKKEK